MRTLDLDELRQIVEIAMDQEVAEFGMDMDLYEDIGMDSMGAVAMVVEIQRRFRVRLKDEEVPDLRTPRSLLLRINSSLTSAHLHESTA